MGKYIDGSGLSHFMGIIKGWAVPKTRTVNGHALSADVTVTASDIGVASGAEVNQNAFSNVKVGSTTVAADSKTDTLELVAGTNVTLTPDSTNDKVTIASTDTNTTYTLTQDSTDGHKITLTPSSGSATTITIPDNDTKALGSMTGTLGVAHGGTGASTLGAGVVYHSASGTGALSIATAANIVSAIGNTAVNRATADASGNNIANTYATKTELGTATAGALQYKGTATKESDISGQAYKKGWYYVVATAGTYFGNVCEVGDMLIAKQDKSSTTSNDWDAVQSNIEVLSNSEIDALWAAA